MNKYIKIGLNLKELRGGLSQSEFSEKLNIPFRTYQRYEAGERLPKAAVLNWIAAVCGVTVDQILTEKKIDDSVAEISASYGTVKITGKKAKISLRKKFNEILKGYLSEKDRNAVFEFAEFLKKKSDEG